MKVTDRDREAADAWLDMYYASAGNFMCEPLYEAFAEARAEARREALEAEREHADRLAEALQGITDTLDEVGIMTVTEAQRLVYSIAREAKAAHDARRGKEEDR